MNHYTVTFDEVAFNKLTALVDAEIERCVNNNDTDNRDEWLAVKLQLDEVKLT